MTLLFLSLHAAAAAASIDNPADIPVSGAANPYTVPSGWTAPNGAKIATRTYGTTTNGLVITNTLGNAKLIAKSTGEYLDARIDGYAYAGNLLLGLGSGNFFYLTMFAPSGFAEVGYATGVDETLSLSNAFGNGTWASLNPGGITSLATLATGYSQHDTTKKWGLERSGLDVIVYYNNILVCTLTNAHWYAPASGAVGFASAITDEGFAGPITASFSAAPTLLSNRLTKTLNLADIGFKPIVTTGSISASSSTLTLTSNPGIAVGDKIAVEPGYVTVTSAVKAGGNTGNGFLRVSTSHHILDGFHTGSPAYRVRVTNAALRTFTVTRVSDSSVVGTGTYGSVFKPSEGPGPEFAAEIGFTVNQGQLPTWDDATQTYVPAVVVPFVDGDGFDITVTATGETATPPWSTSVAAGRLGTVGVGGTYPALTVATASALVGMSRTGLIGGTNSQGGATTGAYATDTGLKFKLTTQSDPSGVRLDVPNPDWTAHYSTNTATPRTITFTRPVIANGTSITAVSVSDSAGYLQPGTTVGALLGSTTDYDRYAISHNHNYTDGTVVASHINALLGGTRWNPIGLAAAAPGEIQVYAGALGAGGLIEGAGIAPGTMVSSISWPTATLDRDVTSTQTNVPGIVYWWNQSFNYYTEWGYPLPLLATVTAVSGGGNTVLTLDTPAVASTSGANVYVDSSSLWTNLVVPIPLSGMTIVVPAGTYGQSAGWIVPSTKTDWTIAGEGRTATILKNIRGGHTICISMTSPVRAIIQDLAGVGLHTTHGLGARYNGGNTDLGFGGGFECSGGSNNIIRRVNITDTIQAAIGMPNNDTFLVDDVLYTSNHTYQNYLAQWQIQAPNNVGDNVFSNITAVCTTTMPAFEIFNGGSEATTTWSGINSTNGYMAYNSTGGQIMNNSSFKFLPYCQDLTTREPAGLNNAMVQSNQNAATGFGRAGISTGSGFSHSGNNFIQVGYVNRFGDVMQAITGQPADDQTDPTPPIFTINGTFNPAVKNSAARGFVAGPVRSQTATGQDTPTTNYQTSAGSLWVRITGPGVVIDGIRTKPYTIAGVTHSTFPAVEGYHQIHITTPGSSSITNTVTGFGAADVGYSGTPAPTMSNNIAGTTYDALP